MSDREPQLHVVSVSPARARAWCELHDHNPNSRAVRIYADADRLRGVNIVDGDRLVVLSASPEMRAQLEICDRRSTS